MSFLKNLFSDDSGGQLSEKQMRTLDPKLVTDPFGKINYWVKSDNSLRVRAYFLMENPIEGAQTGVAIDGSASMRRNFGDVFYKQSRELTGDDAQILVNKKLAQAKEDYVEIFDVNDPPTLAVLTKLGVLKQYPAEENVVEDQARKMTEYLARFDADGGTTVIYWATGVDGKQIEVVGDLQRQDCANAQFKGPKKYGGQTHLLPAIKYFVERFEDARWGMYVFISDGALNDLEEVKAYCIQLAKDIDSGRRNDLKFVLIGIGDEINTSQMEELDDLETGTDIDLWDHKIAKEMRQLAEIFAEVVSETVIIVPEGGVIRDPAGNVIKDFRDTGLPALMVFDMPPGVDTFELEVGGQKITQKIPV